MPKKIDKDALDRIEPADYTVETYQHTQGFFIGGLPGQSWFDRQEDAEAIVAALNIAKRWRKMQRAAERLEADLASFRG